MATIHYTFVSMRTDETLQLLRQVKAAEILGLKHELAEVQDALLTLKRRYAEQRAAEEALALELKAVRADCTSEKNGKRISALCQQARFLYLQELSNALRDSREQTGVQRQSVEQTENRAFELRQKVQVLLGQNEGIRGLIRASERSCALRQERAFEDALAEQWTRRERV